MKWIRPRPKQVAKPVRPPLSLAAPQLQLAITAFVIPVILLLWRKWQRKSAVLRDRLVLRALFKATGGDDWEEEAQRGWKEEEADLSGWHGVEVDARGRVVKLDKSSSGLTNTIPPELGLLGQLEEVCLTENELSGLPKELGQLSQLRVLKLGANQLQKLPRSIGQLTQLSHIHLTDNTLSSLPDEIGQLEALTELDLSCNQLQVWSEGLWQLRQLTALDVSYNPLKEPTSGLWRMSQLRKLSMESTGLSRLPEEIGRLGQLRELSLSYNKLRALPKGLGQLKQLMKLDLSNNQLEEFPREVAMGLGDCKGLESTLDGNAWVRPPAAVVEQGMHAVVGWWDLHGSSRK